MDRIYPEEIQSVNNEYLLRKMGFFRVCACGERLKGSEIVCPACIDRHHIREDHEWE